MYASVLTMVETEKVPLINKIHNMILVVTMRITWE